MEDEEQHQRRKIAGTDFKLERANALNEFARLESHLKILFGVLIFGSQMTPQNAQKEQIIFWGIQSFSARLNIMLRLIRIDHDDKHDIFFQSFVKMTGSINDVRNRIVHWHHKELGGGYDFNPTKDTFMQEPAPGRRKLYKHELLHFSKKARFLANLTLQFAMYLRLPDDDVPAGKKTWKKIFDEKVVYPPLADHPLLPGE